MIIFRFPFSDKLLTVTEQRAENAVQFVSFDENQHISFEGKTAEISKKELLSHEKFSDGIQDEVDAFEEEQHADYINNIQEIVQFVKDENLKKMVYSRIKLLDFSDSNQQAKISLTKTFLNLCESYPNAFVYFFQKESAWMGAFSELLGKFNKKTGEFQTMSLAGTLPVEENWTEKEIEEQKPVSEYIKNILVKFSGSVETSETYDHISGNIKHLRTDFRAKISEEKVEQLISELHPTPAVCGIPKEFCKEAILKFEKYDRKLYAGYIRIETDDEILFFVNLRCAEFYKNCAFVYVGGGITALSDPEKEWRETELKAQAILKNITA